MVEAVVTGRLVEGIDGVKKVVGDVEGFDGVKGVAWFPITGAELVSTFKLPGTCRVGVGKIITNVLNVKINK